jgi:hypothetical protein
MKKRIIVANILLLLCMAALTYKLKQDWEQWNKENNLQTLSQRMKTVPPEIQLPAVRVPRGGVPGNELTYISDNNLFHKDRNMLLPQDQVEEAKPQLTNPPMILGMLTIGGVRYVQVRPEKSSGDEGGSVRLGEGDRWEGDWVVDQIQDDRMVLLAKETREEVLFHDPTKRRPRKPAPQTARATAPGGAGVLTIGASSGKGGPAGRTAAVSPPTSAIKPTPTKTVTARDRSRGGNPRSQLSSRSNSLFQSRRQGAQSSAFGQQGGTTQRSNPMQRSNPFRSNQQQH